MHEIPDDRGWENVPGAPVKQTHLNESILELIAKLLVSHVVLP